MKISSQGFAGGAGLASGDLADALRGITQHFHAIEASAISGVTDNSGGTANGSVVNCPNVTYAVVGTNDAVAKTEAETALGGIRDAIKEIVARCNAIRAVVPAFAALTDSMGGNAADGTIGVIDVSATGAGSSLASAAGMNAVYAVLRARLRLAANYVNALCYATDIAPMTVSITAPYTGEWGTTFSAVSTDTGTAVDGSDVTAANACVKKTEWDAVQAVWADNIAELAAKINAITDAGQANHILDVVAGE